MMKYLPLLILLSCASPTEPESLISEFAITGTGSIIHDVPGGKGILFTAWIVRLEDGSNNPGIVFYIFDNDELLEEVVLTVELAHYSMATDFASRSTLKAYTVEQLGTITIGVGIR